MPLSKAKRKTLTPPVTLTFISVLSVIGFTLGTFLGAPPIAMWFLNTLFAGSTIYLTGVGYGIINDIFATGDSLTYFTNGHNPGQRNLLNTKDRFATAVSWRYMATYGLTFIAAILYMIPTFIMSAVGLPFSTIAMGAVAVLMLPCLAAAHLYTRYKSKKRVKNSTIEHEYSFHYRRHDSYQRPIMRNEITTTTQKNNFLASYDRNGFGYITLPLTGVVGLISLITLTATKTQSLILAAAGSAALAPQLIPIILVGTLALFVLVSTLYMMINHSKPAPNAAPADTELATQASPSTEPSTNSRRFSSDFTTTPQPVLADPYAATPVSQHLLQRGVTPGHDNLTQPLLGQDADLRDLQMAGH